MSSFLFHNTIIPIQVTSTKCLSDFCENCNPHSSYHNAAIGECLVDI